MGLQRDLIFGLRMLRKSPVLVVVATLSLGLGIGLNTTVFSAVHALLLRAPAIERAESLVNFYSAREGVGDLNPNSYADFLDMRDSFESVDALVAYALAMFNYDRRGLPTFEIGTVVSDGYFELLETRPEIGRLFSAEDFETQAPVVIVTDRFWREELDGEPGAIGSTIRLDNRAYQIIGVLPEDFIPFSRGIVTDLFVPITAPAQISPIGESVADDPPNGRNFRAWRGYRFLTVTGRLAPGFTVAQAEAEASVLAASLAEEFPQSDQSRGSALFRSSQVRLDPGFDTS